MMTSTDTELSNIMITPEHGAAIEANDLASLLCRFEEATSSSDDLSIPSRPQKNIKNILLKAKSVGSSPAPTPPATPPPTDGRQVNFSPSTSIEQNGQGNRNVPVHLIFFLNQNNPIPHLMTSSSGTKVSSLPMQINASSKLNCSMSHTSSSHQTGSVLIPKKSSTKITFFPQQMTTVNKKMTVNSKPISTKSSKPSTSKPIIPLPLPLRPTTSQKVSLKEKPSLSLFTPPIGDLPNQQQFVPNTSNKSPTIIGTKRKVVKPATITLDTYKKRKSLSANTSKSCSELESELTKKPINSNSQFNTAAVLKTPAPSLLQAKLESNKIAAAGISLLQSMLQSKTSNKINSKVTSTQLSANLSKKGSPVKKEVKLSNKIKPSPSFKETSVIPSSAKSVSNSSSSQNFPQKVNSQDHDYCFLKMSTKDMIQQTVRTVKDEGNVTDIKIEPLKDAEYEFTKIEPHEFINFGNCDSKEEIPVSDIIPSLGIENFKDEEPGNIEIQDSIFSMEETIPNASSEVINNFVFEEGEFLIDEQGNDIFASEDCSAQNKVEGSDKTFKSDKSANKGRKYRKYQPETSTSPIREDSTNYFDKIPSHYTALSIPLKPIKTTVFASTTRAIGSTDHLKLDDRVEHEHVDHGHFDKVPAHRRCFTNTTKEVDVPEVFIPQDATDSEQTALKNNSHRHSRASSRKRDSSEQSNRHSLSRSPSVPKIEVRRSRSRTRRTRTVSSGSGRSLSSCSTCSSSSYCSTCSSRSWSRSRSRSWSRDQKSRSRSKSCGERYSRSRSNSNDSRSHSAGRKREQEMRSKRVRRHSDSRKGHWDRIELSRSRSRSPLQRSRQRSHHHTGTKSRLAAGGQISQKRKEREEEKVKAMEERRVVYVGKIPEGYTKRQLFKRFESFGDIKEVKVNFREHGDNYGFVTFTYACDAIAAKERGNSIPGERKFDLCFGGRRRFCPDQYADLDGNREIEEEYAPMATKMTDELDYSALLRQHSSAQRKNR